MMFSSILFFFIAVIIISLAPGKSDFLSFPVNLTFIIILILIFFNHIKINFEKLRKEFNEDDDREKFKIGFDKMIGKSFAIALVVFSINLMFLDLKFLFLKIPLLNKFDSIIDIVLLGFFFFLLSLIWYSAYKSARDVFNLGVSVKNYIYSNIKFNLAIIIPWILAVIFENIFILLDLQISEIFINSFLGQALKLILYLILFFTMTPYLITKFWDAEKMSEGVLYSKILDYCKRERVSFKGIMSWNALNKTLITAAVMGVIYPFRYLLLTPRLTELLDDDEILAVVSHEVGHIKKKHIFYYIGFFFTVMPFFVSLSFYLIRLFETTEVGRNLFVLFYEKNNIFNNILTILLIVIFFVIFFRYVFSYFMRNFERQADLYCFQSGVNPEYLVSAFEKLNTVIKEPAKKKNWHHFNIFERVNFIKECIEKPEKVQEHNRKTKKSLLITVILLVLIMSLSYGFLFNNNPIKQEDILKMQIGVYKKLIKKHRDDYKLYNGFAMLNYNAKNWVEAKEAFEKSLKINIAQPEILNNYAWLLLTCEKTELRNEIIALKYAELAWKFVKNEKDISRFTFIMDTLAEAYYKNNFFGEAFKISKKARQLCRDNKEHYERQYQKMKKAFLDNKERGSSI